MNINTEATLHISADATRDFISEIRKQAADLTAQIALLEIFADDMTAFEFPTDPERMIGTARIITGKMDELQQDLDSLVTRGQKNIRFHANRLVAFDNYSA